MTKANNVKETYIFYISIIHLALLLKQCQYVSEFKTSNALALHPDLQNYFIQGFTYVQVKPQTKDICFVQLNFREPYISCMKVGLAYTILDAEGLMQVHHLCMSIGYCKKTFLFA